MKIYSDYESIDNLLLSINNECIDINISFDSNNLKYYFLSKLEDLNNTFNIINCNSGIERFYIDYQLDGIKVFDNLNLCKDSDILKIVKNTKGIIIW
jgi:hypothetical protein